MEVKFGESKALEFLLSALNSFERVGSTSLLISQTRSTTGSRHEKRREREQEERRENRHFEKSSMTHKKNFQESVLSWGN
jgi:hypothetical protein